MAKRNPWSAFYWDDWHTDTAHLNHLEYSIYHRLLTHYYRSRRPLVAIASGLQQLSYAYSTAEQQALASVLTQFFIEKEDGYHQKRADEEIEIALSISKKRAEMGRKGGLAKASHLPQQNSTHPHPQPHIRPDDTRAREDDPDIEIQVREVAALYPKIADPLNLCAADAYAIAEAISRDGRDAVWAGTKSMAEMVNRWPTTERRYIPAAARYFRESQYKLDPSTWEKKPGGDGAGKLNKAEQRQIDNLAANARVKEKFTARFKPQPTRDIHPEQPADIRCKP